MAFSSILCSLNGFCVDPDAGRQHLISCPGEETESARHRKRLCRMPVVTFAAAMYGVKKIAYFLNQADID
jgi:hypothetical protein